MERPGADVAAGAYEDKSLTYLLKAMEQAQNEFSSVGHEDGDAILRQAVLILSDYMNLEGYHTTSHVARKLVEAYDKLDRHFDYEEPD